MSPLFPSRWCAAAALSLAALGGAPAHAQNVGVSISVSQPGVYGRIDIGQFPQPQVVYAQPMIVAPVVGVRPEPVYMWVPPGHRKNWKRYCGRYGACGAPVYFVQDGWYDSHVRPGSGGPGGPRDDDDSPGRGHGRGGDGPGHGHGRGHGHGHGH